MKVLINNYLKRLMSTEHKIRRNAELMIRNPSPWIKWQDDQGFGMARSIPYGRRDCFYLCIDYNKEEHKYKFY